MTQPDHTGLIQWLLLFFLHRNGKNSASGKSRWFNLQNAVVPGALFGTLRALQKINIHGIVDMKLEQGYSRILVSIT